MKSSKVLFVRQFYPRLFAHIRQLRRVVLIGNPGIAKSVFQAYYIHQLLQPGPLPLNHFKSTTPPKVVLRQVGQGKMQVMFLEEELVFTVKEPGIGLVEAFNPETTEYLMEPAGENFEPFFDGLTLPIRASCSPNDSRYKEFTKNGALEAFMPCWTLEELLLAGRVLRERKKEPDGVSFSDEQIINRFNQFGGIIRYVLPSLSGYVDLIERRQIAAASQNTQRHRILSENPDIAVTQGYTAEVSHHLMQYVVDYDTFLPLRLNVASKPLLNIIAMAISDNDFAEGCRNLKRMFNGRQTERPDVFELMVTQGIVRQYFVWHINLNGHWQSFDFPKMKIERLAKDKTPTFAEMQAGLLYRIDYCLFPLVDMFYKSADDEVTGIQVTFAASHAKPATVFQQFRARLQLPPHVRCRVLMVPSPTHAEAYAQRQPADHVAATKASKQGATDEERSHFIDETCGPDREATKKANAAFLQQAKFDIAILQLTWPPSSDEKHMN